jgi:pilus assembly protein CpaB
MKPAKLAVLGVAGVAALGAVWLTAGLRQPPKVIVEQPRDTLPTTEVLVVASEVAVGQVVTAAELRWQTWPQAAVGNGMIARSSEPNGLDDVAGSIARAPSFANEPVRRDKFIKGTNAGFMSAILPSGMRAVAINIVSSGAKSAGGFILPNDRVDVLLTSRDDEATRTSRADVYQSETILRNIRVLAIGQNVQERNGEKVVIGETATLELNPRQAEQIVMAQRSGELSLALRSLVDSSRAEEPVTDRGDLQIVRFGVGQTVNTK